MCNEPRLVQNSVLAQERMFRLAERDYGLSLTALHAETGIPRNTLNGWKNGTVMPAWALGALGKAGVPDYLLSLVLHPFERHVATDCDGDGALHDLAHEGASYSAEYLKATAPDSPGGANVVPMEAAKLREIALRVESKARKVRA